MYETFYRLETEPFRLSPDPRFCFGHKSYARAKAYMQYAFNRAEGFVMVTGRPGTGKTTLIGDLVESLPRSQVTAATLVTTQLEARDLLEMVAHAFGVGSSVSSKAALLQYLTLMLRRERDKGRRALLVIDEAQDLSASALEELRLLTNLQEDGKPLLQIFLVGQDSLRDLVHTTEMEQVFQRIVAACHLDLLTAEETREYVRHRLQQAGWRNDPQLSESLYPIIHRFSEGIPRRINLICGRLLLHGAVEQKHRLGVADARVVVSELFTERLTTLSPQADSMFEVADRFEEEEERLPMAAGGGTVSLRPATPASRRPEPKPEPEPEPRNVTPAPSPPRQPPEEAGPEQPSPVVFPLPEDPGRKETRVVQVGGEAAPVFPVLDDGPLEEGEEKGHSWLWWLAFLALLLAGLAAAWLQGLLG